MAETRQYKIHGAFTELTLARVRELSREPEAVFWVFVFPLLCTLLTLLVVR